jgi:predicted transcriptional regulator
VTEEEREARLAALDAAIERGLADVAAGRTKPAEEVFDRLEARMQARRIAARPRPAEDQAFIDSISEF